MPDDVPTAAFNPATKTTGEYFAHDSRPTPRDPNETTGLLRPAREPATFPVVLGFEIEAELGRGGMGVVYRARQTALNRIVALKMIRSVLGVSGNEAARFVAEAEAVAASKHPNVVQVYDYGEHAGQPFIVLEFLPHGSLADQLRAPAGSNTPTRLDPVEAAGLLMRVAAGVQAAHEQGVVHRDLKPGNILFDAAGEPKVTDFGLARRGVSDMTATGAVLGTPHYMAPEQARGDTKFVGPSADIYALGVILFECLTGTVPFQSDDVWSLVQKVMNDAPPPIRRFAPNTPRDLELICLKCLEKEPHQRYGSAAELAADLRNFLECKPVTARPLDPISRAWRSVQRNKPVAGAIAAVLLSSTIGTVVAVVKANEADRNASSTRTEAKQKDEALEKLTRETSLKDAANKDRENAFQAKEAAASEALRSFRTALYSRDLHDARQRLADGDIFVAEQGLKACPEDLRGWEWRLVNHWAERRVGLLPAVPGTFHPEHFAISSDGRWVASAGNASDGTQLWMWDLKGGGKPVSFAYGLPSVAQVKFDDTGRWLAAISNSGLRVWDTAARDEPHLATAWPPGHELLASRVTTDEITVVLNPPRMLSWSLKPGAKVEPTERKLPATVLSAAALSPGGESVLLAVPSPQPGQERVTIQVTGMDGKLLSEPFEVTGLVRTVSFTPDGKGIVVASYSTAEHRTTLLVSDDRTRNKLRQVSAGPGILQSFAFHKDGKTAVFATTSAAMPTPIGLWDRSSDQIRWLGKLGRIGGVAFHPDGRRVLVSEVHAGVRVWDPAAELPSLAFGGAPMEFLSGFEQLPDDKLMVFGTIKPQVSVVDARGGPGEEFTPDPDEPCYRAAADKLGTHIALAAFRKDAPTVLLYDRQAKKVLHRWPVPMNSTLISLAIDPNGARVAFASRLDIGGPENDYRGVKIYDATTGKFERMLPISDKMAKGAVLSLSFSPDGKQLFGALLSNNPDLFANPPIPPEGEAVMWNAATGAVIWRARIAAGTNAGTYSADGSLVAATCGDNHVRVWRAADGELVRAFPVPSSSVRLDEIGTHVPALFAVALSPDGKRLAAGGAEAIMIWDMVSGQVVLTIPQSCSRLAFTPDGRRLIVDSAAQVLVYDAGQP
jgi:serine/threonine protein kinase/WD40 repeat protein